MNMTTTTENAPSLSGNSAEGETETLLKGTIMNDVTSVPLTTDNPRYAVFGSDVYDKETGAVAGFPDAEHARLGAEWMNSGNAKITDYAWSDPNADDEGPYVGDVLRAADILRVTPGELIGVIEPLLRAKHEQRKTLRRPADVDERLRALDD